ncbi:MAG: hypothetical protein JXR96_07200 [Deltaproteobacteria bacterium]|nr:hypothetical protein [Deltaproteobacteria bacterium]
MPATSSTTDPQAAPGLGRLWLGLLAAAAACGPGSGHEETYVCVWEGEGTPPALLEIGCPQDFELLAAVPLSTALPGILSVKFAIDQASGEDRLYFQDTASMPLHHSFAYTYLNGTCGCSPDCGGTCDCELDPDCADCPCECARVERACELPAVPDINTFNAIEYRTPDRRFLLGSVDHHEDQDLYTLDLTPVDTADAAMVEKMFRAVRAQAFFGDRLSFLPQSVSQESVAAELPSDIPVISTAELYAGLDYQPLNPGECVGQVRILLSRDLEQIYVSPRDIVVLDSVPNDISPVAGIITAEFQTPLAHVNVLSRNRGTPNMGLRGATADSRISDLEGGWARLIVGADEWSLEAVTPDEAEQWWEAHKPEPLEVPGMDLGVQDLIDLDSVGIEAMPYVGAKAANFAELQKVAFRGRSSSFDRSQDLGGLPAGWSAESGAWAVTADPGSTSGAALLRQSSAQGGPHTAGVDVRWRNFSCAASVIATPGQAAGLALLRQPGAEHYVVSTDGAELRIAKVDPQGQTTSLASASLEPPAGAVAIEARVHDRQLRVSARAWPDGAPVELCVVLPSHPPGSSCQLWTAAGASAGFDDFSLAPIYNPRAFAVPFFFFRQFMEQNGFDAELQALLGDPEFRADGSVRRCELARLRERMQQAPVDAGLTELLDAKLLADFPGMRMRFRSSTNAEDLGSYTGAGLYTSAAGQPGDPDRTLLDALRTVWASLFNFRAFEEREILSIPHDRVAMAVLVHRSFPWELANGVAITNNVFDRNEPAYYVNAQIREVSVTNPPPGVLPDQFLYYWSSFGATAVYLSHSTLTDGEPVMSESEIHELAVALQAIHLHFMPFLGASFFAMDTEFKLDWPDRALVIKQARPFPKPGE